ncbi:Glycerophosphodiester phosphodiesterase domain-containing protein 5 [Collichthys lucidus]|uniref:Glycerophosphodiester phosphodiesterase domain-containing protein 5 n=1 Tax=Collichthys lucidus TaxID=240159 RepID=A0A4U5UYU3_COLLU|nr:Glycerophosphodiester phosphodiesterase domain-containing protein 5 [Collichthys lucidus]
MQTGIVVTLAFSVTATAILSDLWSKEWKTLLLSLQVTAPFLHVAAVALMAILSWPIALHFFRMNKKVRQVAVLGLYLSVLFFLYLVPLGMYSPCIKEAGTLGPAPTLIGHRGAPMTERVLVQCPHSELESLHRCCTRPLQHRARASDRVFKRFNFGTLGFWFPWSLVLLVVAASLFTYIALLLTGIVVTLAFSVTATAILSDLWSKEWKTLLLSLQVTAPFLHVAAVALMAILSWPIALHFFRMNKKVRQVAVLGLYLSVLFFLYLVPLGMYSPCIKEAGTLGPAPTLIGHRGAPMRDPFGTVSTLSEADCFQAQNQSIPSLAQFLELAARSGRLVLFDLRRPPYGHPYSQSYINTTLQVVQAHINSSQAVDPKLQQTSGEKASIQELTDSHITRLNLHYSTMLQQQISKYQSENISTNLYVISQPWLYTLAWCAGAQSVTTNSIHILSDINKPLFLMLMSVKGRTAETMDDDKTGLLQELYFFISSCTAFHHFFAPTTATTTDHSPVVVSRRYLSICGKVISGRSSVAPYRSRNEQTSAKLGQSAGPELLTTTGAAIFPGGEKQEGRARCGMRLCAGAMNGGSEEPTGVKLGGTRGCGFRDAPSK